MGCPSDDPCGTTSWGGGENSGGGNSGGTATQQPPVTGVPAAPPLPSGVTPPPTWTPSPSVGLPPGTPLVYNPTYAPGWYPSPTPGPYAYYPPIITGDDLRSWLDNLTAPGLESSWESLPLVGPYALPIQAGLNTLNLIVNWNSVSSAPPSGPISITTNTPTYMPTLTPQPDYWLTPVPTSPFITPIYNIPVPAP